MATTVKTTRGGTAAASSAAKAVKSTRKVTGEVREVGDLVYPRNGEESVEFSFRTSRGRKVTLVATGFVALGVSSILSQGDNIEVEIDQSKGTAGQPYVSYVKNITTGAEVSMTEAAEVDAAEDREEAAARGK
jgi:hypothetical protein